MIERTVPVSGLVRHEPARLTYVSDHRDKREHDDFRQFDRRGTLLL
jgi:hypothetical protein